MVHASPSGQSQTVIEWQSGPPAAAGVFALLRSPDGHLQLRMLPAADESIVSEVSQSPIACIWPPAVLARLQLSRQYCSQETLEWTFLTCVWCNGCKACIPEQHLPFLLLQVNAVIDSSLKALQGWTSGAGGRYSIGMRQLLRALCIGRP